MFQSTNKLPTTSSQVPQPKQASKKAYKDANYQNTNYISSNGNGGFNSISIGAPQLDPKDKNNLSMLSSSTVDSKDLEIIVDAPPNRNLISTQYRVNKLGNQVAPPGQVFASHHKLNSSSYTSIGPDSNIAKRQTQGIAAIAAQRKAFQHHKELMSELGQQEQNAANRQQELTASRLAKHDLDAMNDLFEKKNSVLTDNSTVNSRAKKQVKIRDIVQYKLPDEDIREQQVSSQNFFNLNYDQINAGIMNYH